MAYQPIQARGRAGIKARVVFTFDFAAEEAAGTFEPVPLDPSTDPLLLNGAGTFDAAELTAFRAGTLVQRNFNIAVPQGATPAQVHSFLNTKFTAERAAHLEFNRREFRVSAADSLHTRNQAGDWTVA